MLTGTRKRNNSFVGSFDVNTS